MPSRKQRRRQAKGRRHEYEYIYVDDEGREIEVAEEERPAPKKPAEAKSSSPAAASRGGRAPRKIEPPTWRRAAKRALLFGGVFILIFFVAPHKGANRSALALDGILFAVMMVPLFYFLDSATYRTYLKRTGQAPPRRPRKEPRPKTD